MRTIWAMVCEDDGLIDAAFATKRQCKAACNDAAKYGYGLRVPLAITLTEADEPVGVRVYWRAMVGHNASEAPGPIQCAAFTWETYTPEFLAMLDGEPRERWFENGACIVEHVSLRACEDMARSAFERIRDARV